MARSSGSRDEGRATGGIHIGDRSGWFAAGDDEAVCAPIGTDPLVCRVNDVLRVVAGAGAFADAAGSLRNQGVIDLNTFTITLEIRGRVCGDGIGA